MKAIADSLKPSVITLNEHLMINQKGPTIQGYKCINSKRKTSQGGGIATLVQSGDSAHTLKVFEGENDLELLITRHSQFGVIINILNVYGVVESRSNKDEINDRWNKIQDQINKIESRGELLVIIGDLNVHVGDIIPSNSSKVSCGGKLLKEFLESGNYILINALERTKGGPFTRVDPSNDQIKSVLDLVIVSQELLKYVDTFVIDDARSFTPCRPRSRDVLTYSDHYSLLVHFKALPTGIKKNSVTGTSTKWNTNKVDGWLTYKALSTDNKVMEDVASDDKSSATTLMKKLDRELLNLKHKAFGKVKVRNSCKNDKEIVKLQNEKIEAVKQNSISDVQGEKISKIDEKIATCLLSKQRENFMTDLNQMREKKKSCGNVAAIFNLKEKVLGPKTVATEAVSLYDPKTGELVNTPSEIKRVSLEYCSNLLTNRKPKEKYECDVEFKFKIHENRMNETLVEDMTDLPEELFNLTYDKLMKKDDSKYKFIMNAGESLKPALLKICKVAWKTENLPPSWHKSLLIQICKGKWPREELRNHRFIHTKNEFPKFFGNLVMTAAKDTLVNGMSKFQIGAKPGHRAQEHLFTIKSVISFFTNYDKAVILSTWDISKFFDRENCATASMKYITAEFGENFTDFCIK